MWPTEDAWHRTVPDRLAAARWDLRPGRVITGGSVSHVQAVTTADGGAAVLKLSFPHREARDEAAALAWWGGEGAVRLLAVDPDDPFVLLLERCDPGTRLVDRTDLSAAERMAIGADAVARLWAAGVPDASPFERVADVCDEWADLAEERMRTLAPPLDPGIVRHGIALLRELPRSAPTTVVVHGDHNPGNVLMAGREPWLVIDPKPMTGDPAYDLCPLLVQVDDPFAHPDPGTVLADRVGLLADRTGLAPDRVLAWSVARMVESALWYASRAEVGAAREAAARAARIADLLG
ncbi:streptomycin 6-kinase [Curtobacterium luteum]|uniref:Hydroxyurea phosphotransferase n=1 Tax=Curtobacterium luteum TaxID=33881 RepID=A0A8H9L1G8_9MICO|nr:aminoglycoside phosphotransferase family protein [Curtobacterium luteum]MBM7802691.1 streptomycin 6-kinase [Curtobacterium luteum]NUU49694.1 phosphotransferase [Curtobacterium luteum]GGL10679.1 hydroxyurea phosphotransferase [Curtobacterium luteum]